MCASFNEERLVFARKRRGLTARALAELASLTPQHLSSLEKGSDIEPEKNTVARLSQALGFPVVFFYLDNPPDIPGEMISFRSAARLTIKDKNIAQTLSCFGSELNNWFESKFFLPKADSAFFEKQDRTADDHSLFLRAEWGLGQQPIGNLFTLLETKGVRFFSLPENIETIDAFSFWHGNTPYIFLNMDKSAERIRFDIAHELGHIIMHQDPALKDEDIKQREIEANCFASAFLMPERDVRAIIPHSGVVNVNSILHYKKRWRVSAMSLIYRLHKLNIIAEWRYRKLCIEFTRMGYRKTEADGIELEKPSLWSKVLTELWKERITKNKIAEMNVVPLEDIEGIMGRLLVPVRSTPTVRPPARPVRRCW